MCTVLKTNGQWSPNLFRNWQAFEWFIFFNVSFRFYVFIGGNRRRSRDFINCIFVNEQTHRVNSIKPGSRSLVRCNDISFQTWCHNLRGPILIYNWFVKCCWVDGDTSLVNSVISRLLCFSVTMLQLHNLYWTHQSICYCCSFAKKINFKRQHH